MNSRVWPVTIAISVGASLVLAGCSKKEPAKADSKPSANSASKPPEPPKDASPEPAATKPVFGPKLEEASVRTLVDGWLKAQNAGDFSAYSAFYAPRFTGVKRSGNFTQQYSHEEWLKDRKGMFAKPQTVTLSDLEVGVTPQGARVLFTQKWQSGTYADVGPKQLVIISTDQGPRIAREEMLASTILGKTTGPNVPAGLFVAIEDGVILTTNTKESWISGAPTGTGTRVAYANVKIEAIPKDLLELRGRPLRLMGPNGVLCETSIVRLKVRAEVVPHFGTAAQWAGEHGATKPAPAEVASQVWELSQRDGRVLIGELATPCRGAVWAMETSAPVPALASPEPAPAELGAAAFNAFRALPKYQEIQKKYEMETSPKPSNRWEDASGGVKAAWIVRPKNAPALLFVSVARNAGCAEFGDSLSALFQVKDEAKQDLELKSVIEPSDWFTLRPRAAFDFEADGSYEILLGPDGPESQISLLRAQAGVFAREILARVPYLDCPC